MASALVLFDVDGCTAIVDSKKLVLNGKDLVTGQKGHMKLGREELHVEILKVSDSKRFLNEFEDEWSTTHRSIALDKEKKKRKNRPGGYLSVWPQDMDDVVTPVEELPDPAEEQPKENEDVEVTGARKKTAARKTKEKAKEKS
ncbi:uncharacterized protein LOC134257979, partial [Saccostrea cucullata]|uniref:uncharacterized protein LOC134257979 n=1 Tax=Saccostrea cuccullata TaxID=36930 RepID=UPI002ED68C09